MYVFGALASRNRSYQLLRALKDDPAAGRRALACLSAGSLALAQSGPGTGAPNAGAADRSWSGGLTTYL
jgi:hypothetical protein